MFFCGDIKNFTDLQPSRSWAEMVEPAKIVARK